MATPNKMPMWLTAALVILLLVLVAAVATLLPRQKEAQQLRSAVPDVTFEDFQAAPILPHIAPLPAPAHKAPAPFNAKPRHGVAFILDDVGYNLDALRRILALNVPVAISVLPDSPQPGKAAEMAHQAGQMVMLHLPMEPDTAKYRDQMDSSFLRVGMDAGQMRRTFLQNLAQVPYVEGVNNHMGSHLTRLPEAMQPLMRILREEGLFFVDSKTSAHSVAAEAAAAAGLPWAARQIFLDHRQDEAYMQAAWQKALACQAMDHACVMIGHPHPETVDFLERMLSGKKAIAPEKQLRLTPIRALLRVPQPGSAVNNVASGLPAVR